MDAISFVLGVDTNLLRSSSTDLQGQEIKWNEDENLIIPTVSRASVEAKIPKTDGSIVVLQRCRY